MLVAVLVALLLIGVTIAAPPTNLDIDIADQDIEFTDQSALADTKNLQSEQYNAFIHELYRFDADNLQKFDSLYEQTAWVAGDIVAFV